MTDPTTDTRTAELRTEAKMTWPEEPIEMLNEMRSAQVRSLHDMFATLTDHAKEEFQKYPYEAQDYIRLALRAQANCRMTMADIVRTELASRRGRAESEK